MITNEWGCYVNALFPIFVLINLLDKQCCFTLILEWDMSKVLSLFLVNLFTMNLIAYLHVITDLIQTIGVMIAG